MFDIPSGSKTEYVIKYISGNRIPLLKLSEMYLIAAEASGDIRFLETLRGFRGYAGNPLPADANLSEELRKEYQKEFIAEGSSFISINAKHDNNSFHGTNDESGNVCIPDAG